MTCCALIVINILSVWLSSEMGKARPFACARSWNQTIAFSTSDSSSYHYIYFNGMLHLRVSTDHVIEQVRQLTLSGPLHSHTTSGRGENGAVAEEYAPMALS
jgi:hypothetical protein